MLHAISHCRTKFAVLVAIAALLLVPGLATLGGGQALAQDVTVDCSDPANAFTPECDPSSTFSAFGASNASGTITWSASAICDDTTGNPSGVKCTNAGTSPGGFVPNGYNVAIWGNRQEDGATTCSTGPPGLYKLVHCHSYSDGIAWLVFRAHYREVKFSHPSN